MPLPKRATRTPLIPEGLDATLVLLRHGESEWIVEHRFQGQAETPLSDAGRRQAALAGERLARPHASPGPAGAAAACRSRSSIRRCRGPPQTAGPSPTRSPRGRRDPASAPVPVVRPDPGLPRDRAGRVGGRPPGRDRAPLAGRPRALAPPAVGDWAPGGESPGAGPGARAARAADRPRAARPGLPARDARPPAGRAATRARARRPTSRGRSSSATTACSRSRC